MQLCHREFQFPTTTYCISLEKVGISYNSCMTYKKHKKKMHGTKQHRIPIQKYCIKCDVNIRQHLDHTQFPAV